MGYNENWYNMLKGKMESDGEAFEERKCTLSDSEMKENFSSGYGGTEGVAFTAWGKNWVYFPICYDGAEWIGHAPRNPCDTSMEHQGGD